MSLIKKHEILTREAKNESIQSPGELKIRLSSGQVMYILPGEKSGFN